MKLTKIKVAVLTFAAVAIVMFPPMVERWEQLSPAIPVRIDHHFEFIGGALPPIRNGVLAYSIEIDWAHWSLEGATFVLVAAFAFRRRGDSHA